MPDTFQCPSCGAPLTTQGDAATITCPFCSNSVIVPPEARPAAPGIAGMPAMTMAATGDLRQMLSALNADMPELTANAQHLRQMVELARSGHKAEAVAIYRQVLGGTQEQAEMALDAIASGQHLMLSQLPLSGATVRTVETSFTTPGAGPFQTPATLASSGFPVAPLSAGGTPVAPAVRPRGLPILLVLGVLLFLSGLCGGLSAMTMPQFWPLGAGLACPADHPQARVVTTSRGGGVTSSSVECVDSQGEVQEGDMGALSLVMLALGTAVTFVVLLVLYAVARAAIKVRPT
jgi:uncharacterized Zn finger protein (UPF0148 family)